MITLIEYRSKFAEHDAVNDDAVQECIDEANSNVNPEFLGTNYSRALLYYAAHLVQTDYVDTEVSSSSPGGTIKRQKIGPLEIEFETSHTSSVGDESYFSQTRYGQRYLRYVKSMMGPVSY